MRLREFIATSNYEFWPDDISLLNPVLFDLALIASPLRLTDCFLLALAVEKGGRLVTFDKSIPTKAVHGATNESLLVLQSDPIAAG